MFLDVKLFNTQFLKKANQKIDIVSELLIAFWRLKTKKVEPFDSTFSTEGGT